MNESELINNLPLKKRLKTTSKGRKDLIRKLCEKDRDIHFFFAKLQRVLSSKLDLIGLVGQFTFKMLKTIIISKFSAKIKKVFKFSNWGQND